MDPAGIDRDPVGQIDVILGISAEHGCGVDIHLHDSADLGAFQMELIIERAERLGLQGKVNFAHGFAIAEVSAARRRDLLQAMAGLGMTFTTVAPLRLPQVVAGSFVAGHAQGAARSARRRTGAAGRARRRPG